MSLKSKPAVKAVVVSPDDNAIFLATRGFMIETSANVSVLMAEGNAPVILRGLAAGIMHPLSIVKVLATNTGGVGQVTVFY